MTRLLAVWTALALGACGESGDHLDRCARAYTKYTSGEYKSVECQPIDENYKKVYGGGEEGWAFCTIYFTNRSPDYAQCPLTSKAGSACRKPKHRRRSTTFEDPYERLLREAAQEKAMNRGGTPDTASVSNTSSGLSNILENCGRLGELDDPSACREFRHVMDCVMSVMNKRSGDDQTSKEIDECYSNERAKIVRSAGRPMTPEESRIWQQIVERARWELLEGEIEKSDQVTR